MGQNLNETVSNSTQSPEGILAAFTTSFIVKKLEGAEEKLKTALDSGNVTPEIIGAALAQHKNRNGL